MNNIHLDLQTATKDTLIPTYQQINDWVQAAFNASGKEVGEVELCIRLIDEAEMAELNQTYRHKSGATNVLSFPYENEISDASEIPLIGDVAICAPVVNREAQQKNIDHLHYWARIVIHGCLHILGYDHETDEQAEVMERMEERIMING